jgi:hypothetical protein
VTRYKIHGHYYSPNWVKEKNDLNTEVIITKSERAANYIHQGWSLSAASIMSPWISSRLSNNIQANKDGSWVSKRAVFQRFALNIPLRELEPVPEFETEILDALSKSTKAEKFQALYEAFSFW